MHNTSRVSVFFNTSVFKSVWNQCHTHNSSISLSLDEHMCVCVCVFTAWRPTACLTSGRQRITFPRLKDVAKCLTKEWKTRTNNTDDIPRPPDHDWHLSDPTRSKTHLLNDTDWHVSKLKQQKFTPQKNVWHQPFRDAYWNRSFEPIAHKPKVLSMQLHASWIHHAGRILHFSPVHIWQTQSHKYSKHERRRGGGVRHKQT